MHPPEPNSLFERFSQWLIIAGWLALPLSHFRWLPNLGTTRPVSGVLFTLALGLMLIDTIVHRLPRRIEPGEWLKLIKRDGIHQWDELMRRLPEWKILRWWIFLLALGVVSAAITPLYGNFFQALNRLLGYFLILLYLWIGFYSLRRFGILAIAKWTALGYTPVLIYAIFEALALSGFTWAGRVVEVTRRLVVDFNTGGRMALLATEPSFVTFQVLLLIAIFPYLRTYLLRGVAVALVLLSLVYSQSGTMMIVIGMYVLVLVLWGLPRRVALLLTGGAAAAALALFLAYLVLPSVQTRIRDTMSALDAVPRIHGMVGSWTIRAAYVLNLIWVIIDTRGLGLGVGQYGQFWRSYFLRHIDYKSFDETGEVARTLASDIYMRPWSVIFGIGADLGIFGMLLLLGFFADILRLCKSAHAKAVFAASIVALLGAYPIVTPHVWLALALIAGVQAIPPSVTQPPVTQIEAALA